MKLSNILIIVCCFLSVGYGIYLKYVAPAYNSYLRISKAKEGMTRQQLTTALSAPDSTYWEQSGGDSLLVMTYELPDTDGSTIRIKLRDDTVRIVNYHK